MTLYDRANSAWAYIYACLEGVKVEIRKCIYDLSDPSQRKGTAGCAIVIMAFLDKYLVNDLMREMDWFKEYLPSPDDHYFDCAGANVGICWFRDHAKTMIRRARRMVNILSAGDIWVTEARTDKPGRILYRDNYQIIAKPAKSTPTKWRQTNKQFRR